MLLVSVNSRYPEVEDWYAANPAIHQLARELFDDIVVLNEHIFPTHPMRWAPRGADEEACSSPAWIDPARIDEIFVESIQIPPARTLAQLCANARIHIQSDGLMVYSPTRVELPDDVLCRVDNVFYVDYLPGVRPLLLEEASPTYQSIPPETLRAVFDPLRVETGDPILPGTVVVLGQAFESDRVMTMDGELSLYLDALLALGNEERIPHVAFKPHSRSPSSSTRALAARYRQATGQELAIISADRPLEAVLLSSSVAAVVGVFSTALFTAARLFGLPVFKFRPKDVLYKLQPFANSNRIPLIASDMFLPSVSDLLTALRARQDEPFEVVCRDAAAWDTKRACADFRDAQIAVGYYMQPQILRHRKAEAERIVAEDRVPCLDLYLRGAPTLAETRRRERRRIIDRALYNAMSPLLPERKARKLKRAPSAFFQDSRHLSMRALGQLYKVLIR